MPDAARRRRLVPVAPDAEARTTLSHWRMTMGCFWGLVVRLTRVDGSGRGRADGKIRARPEVIFGLLIHAAAFARVPSWSHRT